MTTQTAPAPKLRSRARRPPALLAAAAAAAVAAGAVAAAIAVTAPTASPPAHQRAAPAAAGLIGGVPLQQARCAQWLTGSRGERDRTVAALAHVVGGPTPYGPGTTLAAPEASRLFDYECAAPFAHNFLLYELYIRAAGFRSIGAH